MVDGLARRLRGVGRVPSHEVEVDPLRGAEDTVAQAQVHLDNLVSDIRLCVEKQNLETIPLEEMVSMVAISMAVNRLSRFCKIFICS